LLHYASSMIRERYLHSVGLFRLSAAHATIASVGAAIDGAVDSGKSIVTTLSDANVIACLVKKWLRELPEPLLTPAEQWLAIADTVNQSSSSSSSLSVDDAASDEQLAKQTNEFDSITSLLRDAIAALPEHNRNVFCELLVLTKALSLNSHINKMTSCNLATVIAPNLLYSSDPLVSSTGITTINTLVETMIDRVDLLIAERLAAVEFVVLPSPNSAPSVCDPALVCTEPSTTVTTAEQAHDAQHDTVEEQQLVDQEADAVSTVACQ
jgi:hypothetical protein